MIKDTDFWLKVCEEFNYRFFSGVPFEEVNALFWGMLPDKMHYIPAINENAAVSLAAGAWVSGLKSGVIINSSKLNEDLFKVNKLFNIPVLVITTGEVYKGLYSNNDLVKVIEYIEKKGKPGAFIYEEIHGS